MIKVLGEETNTKNARRIPRIAISLPTRIEGEDSHSEKWDEITHIKDISPFGAGFNFSKPIERGRLVKLTLPMPRKMRCYDFAETQYKVWGLVRRCIKDTDSDSDSDKYFIGVAFIGKIPPNSYIKNPSKIYEISNRNEKGLWQITSVENKAVEDKNSVEDRKHSRYSIPLNLIVEVTDKNGNIIRKEPTVSENISLGGVSVFTSLDIKPGTNLNIKSSQYKTSIQAIVRSKRVAPDGISRLHIEFVSSFFPLSGIELP